MTFAEGTTAFVESAIRPVSDAFDDCAFAGAATNENAKRTGAKVFRNAGKCSLPPARHKNSTMDNRAPPFLGSPRLSPLHALVSRIAALPGPCHVPIRSSQ